MDDFQKMSFSFNLADNAARYFIKDTNAFEPYGEKRKAMMLDAFGRPILLEGMTPEQLARNQNQADRLLLELQVLPIKAVGLMAKQIVSLDQVAADCLLSSMVRNMRLPQYELFNNVLEHMTPGQNVAIDLNTP